MVRTKNGARVRIMQFTQQFSNIPKVNYDLTNDSTTSEEKVSYLRNM